MPKITLPDGSVKTFDAPVTGFDIAASIGSGLAQAAVAMNVNGKDVDLSTTVTTDATVSILTVKDDAGLDVVRHTTAAQVLAKAIKELYPSAKLAIGPTVDYGFYYDVAFEEPISSEELPKIEEKMREIMATGATIQREELPAEDVKAAFAARGETYKVQIIEDAIAKGNLLNGGKLSVYRQGEGKEAFIDLCYGPHVPNLKHISKAFKLTNLAGAYWRGDSNNEMLTRIYGVSFADKKELQTHLTMLEEAAKRDHRKLGKQMNLFHMQEEAPGQIFWHHKGWTVYLELENYMRKKCREHNYIEVNTPQVMDVEIWKTSGHWEKFKDDMMTHKEGDREIGLKPMSCPGDIQVYKQYLTSYRDLPIRMAEFGRVFRNEASGALHGLMRVKAFTQDDAHIFCTEEQMEDEVVAMVTLLREVYSDLGFPNFRVKFSDRPERRLGTDAIWDKSEAALKAACDKAGIEWTLNPGEGAFYGPKLEFVLQDCIGRDWQCGTIQLDLNMPERFEMEYIASDGSRQRPIMIHRAILGSLERFIGILIENYAGAFPVWLAPTQVVLMGITSSQDKAVQEYTTKLRALGIRVEADLRNEKVNYKIREHSHQKVPVIGVLGDKEIANGTITIRRLGSAAQQTMDFDIFITNLMDEIKERRLPQTQAEAA
jgi:threonyl-tRNA synthetase